MKDAWAIVLTVVGIIAVVVVGVLFLNQDSGSGPYTSLIVPEKIKLNDVMHCSNCRIKFLDSGENSNASYYITPSGFEWDKLEK